MASRGWQSQPGWASREESGPRAHGGKGPGPSAVSYCWQRGWGHSWAIPLSGSGGDPGVEGFPS